MVCAKAHQNTRELHMFELPECVIPYVLLVLSNELVGGVHVTDE
jgi:hypothetical protein